MKTILIRSAKILFPNSSFFNQQADVLIEAGRIKEIATKIAISNLKDIQIVEAAGKFLAPGFFDLNVNFGEPGLETKETLDSGARAAFAGGYTAVATQPQTEPSIHSKSEVTYLLNRARTLPIDIYPVGCVSVDRQGKDLAELYDMHQAGAKAFSDGTRAISDSGLMSRALQYAKGFGALIMSFPEDTAVSGKGRMNEGKMSTYLGMKGIPALAEELFVSRDLFLAEYNETKVHFSTISCKGSVELIRAARKKGLAVTCDVAAHHLVFTEDKLIDFDSNFKVKPPLRTQEDLEALKQGLLDGTIDAVVSQHTPQEVEFKDVEFEIAYSGIIGLQTALPIMVEAGFTAEQIVEKMSLAPRRILDLALPVLAEGEQANLVVFDTEAKWLFDKQTNYSLASNSPFLGQELKGKAVVVANKGELLVS